MKSKCCRCGEEKDIDAFYNSKSTPTGKEGRCKACKDVQQAVSYLKHRHKNKSKKRSWAKSHREQHRLIERNYYHRHKDNKAGQFRAKVNRRRGMISKATPPWVDRKAIEDVYQKCPKGYAVDHIIPLQAWNPDGTEACGLHVPWNLQYITFSENGKKGRRFDPKGGTNYSKEPYKLALLLDSKKICTGCNSELDLIHFRKDASRKDGYEYRCKACSHHKKK